MSANERLDIMTRKIANAVGSRPAREHWETSSENSQGMFAPSESERSSLHREPVRQIASHRKQPREMVWEEGSDHTYRSGRSSQIEDHTRDPFSGPLTSQVPVGGFRTKYQALGSVSDVDAALATQADLDMGLSNLTLLLLLRNTVFTLFLHSYFILAWRIDVTAGNNVTLTLESPIAERQRSEDAAGRNRLGTTHFFRRAWIQYSFAINLVLVAFLLHQHLGDTYFLVHCGKNGRKYFYFHGKVLNLKFLMGRAGLDSAWKFCSFFWFLSLSPSTASRHLHIAFEGGPLEPLQPPLPTLEEIIQEEATKTQSICIAAKLSY